ADGTAYAVQRNLSQADDAVVRRSPSSFITHGGVRLLAGHISADQWKNLDIVDVLRAVFRAQALAAMQRGVLVRQPQPLVHRNIVGSVQGTVVQGSVVAGAVVTHGEPARRVQWQR